MQSDMFSKQINFVSGEISSDFAWKRLKMEKLIIIVSVKYAACV